ncbi:hypothetical protein SASPL_105654 [Salvia splendens]|uniref:Uncharacterized protein n=1 Tax=Salvia splendens TaxID=180675 RepID=A0A8X8YJL0_SALSN|nr:hypothetical protein SASPL_105654 [Salvia splendens]
MWQFIVAAAAAAGSGILAKKLITPHDTDCDIKYLDSAETKSSPPQDSVFESNYTLKENTIQENAETLVDEAAIFRFSSPEIASKELRTNTRNGFRNGGPKRGKKKNAASEACRKEAVADQVGFKSGKRISVCLKKRRTGKHAAGKCESCVSKDNSFGWGVGVGIMYMVSAGTAEISKLNSAMCETVKTVEELKAEISKRKNSQNVSVPVAGNEAGTNKKFVESCYKDPSFTRAATKSEENMNAFSPALTDEGECASSILTNNQHSEVLEMHQLEAELESELQKLPWSGMEASSSDGRTDIYETEVLAKGEAFENASSYQYNGVSAGELDQKLCHLLVEQQESQIMELEAELNEAHSKLHQKETELQKLRDYEEGENEEADVQAITDGIEEKKAGLESMVGMKRSIGCTSYICSGK